MNCTRSLPTPSVMKVCCVPCPPGSCLWINEGTMRKWFHSPRKRDNPVRTHTHAHISIYNCVCTCIYTHRAQCTHQRSVSLIMFVCLRDKWLHCEQCCFQTSFSFIITKWDYEAFQTVSHTQNIMQHKRQIKVIIIGNDILIHGLIMASKYFYWNENNLSPKSNWKIQKRNKQFTLFNLIPGVLI